jgi:UDP-glucose 4-epimerase
MSTFLVTGGAGYIGSHMCVELLQAGNDVVVADNLSNSSEKAIEAVRRITQKDLEFLNIDLRDADALQGFFDNHAIDAVIHFAGLKAVGESVTRPGLYYDNNVNGTLRLIEAMASANVKTLVFSSSATVYGMTEEMPITESHLTQPINPYGRTKLMIEDMLKDIHAADPEWRISLLRYFNPVGAHPSGEIGENPNGIPNNLVPNITQVAVGKRPQLKVFGNDYPTADGTCIRDYIHVLDLVSGHLAALRFLETNPGCFTHNLGTGNGYSVMQVLRAIEEACGKEIPFVVEGRRPGDAAESYADASKALNDLGWQAKFDLSRMCQDTWRWQSTHPDGFSD